MILSKFKFLLISVLVVFSIFHVTALEEYTFDYSDSWSNHGISLDSYSDSNLIVSFSIRDLEIIVQQIEQEKYHKILMNDVFLPNNEGFPDLPVMSNFIAIPVESGVNYRIVAKRYEVLTDMNILPAFRIPHGNDDEPLQYTKNERIYSDNTLFPENIVTLSEETQFRGMDVIILSITPFQYNPVTGDLYIFRDLEIELDFIGGNGEFGNDRLRSRWFDKVYTDLILNYQQISPRNDLSFNYRDDYGYEYLIIVPDDPDFIYWANEVRHFRNMQGIKTGIVTTTETGGNNYNSIKNYISFAYNNWDIPPVAVLLMGDHGTSGNTISSEFRNDHPYISGQYISDHGYSDMNNNNLSDIIMARITAQNSSDLENLVTKFIEYENNPPNNFAFYNNPITAMGWQTERWFQLCTETVARFWQIELGKQPVRQNAIYSGNPGTVWSSNDNTPLILNFFGPDGLNYIPSDPSYLQMYGWGASANTINYSLNNGAFMMLHRNHGSVNGWSTPSYQTANLQGLSNNDLTFVFSINCSTGKFNSSTPSFAEAFHRHQHGALGILAPTEVSYSFVNDTFVWGAINYMWPQFMPNHVSNPEYRSVMPAFANVAGKYYLQQSNWPTNPEHKHITYYLFHHHGDAFSTVYTEMPEELTVNHLPVLICDTNSFSVTANEDALISLTVDGEIIGTAIATGNEQLVTIIPQQPPTIVDITVTKQNFYRYHDTIQTIVPEGPYIVFDSYTVDDHLGNNNGQIDYGETISLYLGILNVGTETANNVSVTLNSESDYVTITDNFQYYGVVEPDAMMESGDAFVFEVDHSVPNNYQLFFSAAITDGVSEWESSFYVRAYAPVLGLFEVVLDDSGYGNNNGMFDPGETVEFNVSIKNTGLSDAFNTYVTLTSLDPFVSIIDSDPILLGDILSQEIFTQSFIVNSCEFTPESHNSIFNISIEADYGITGVGVFQERIGEYLIEEYFDVWLPDGWETTSTSGQVNWSLNSSNDAGGESPEARFHFSPSTLAVQRLISKPINTSALTSVELEFKHMVNHYSGDYILRVETTSDGENWTEVVSYDNINIPSTLVEMTIDNEDVGSEDFRIAWTFDGNSWNINWWCIDDVILKSGSLANTAEVQGTVTLSGGIGNVEDVLITAGDFYITPDDSGFYSLSLPPGFYDISASLQGYEAITHQNTLVPHQQSIEIDYNLGYVEIVVDPTSFDIIAVQGSEITEILTINNTGIGVLEYTIQSLDASVTNLSNNNQMGSKNETRETFLISEQNTSHHVKREPKTTETKATLLSNIRLDWLDVYPETGFVSPGDLVLIDLIFNLSDVEIGHHLTDIVVINNAGDNIIIPIEIEVVENPDLIIDPQEFNVVIYPNEVQLHELSIFNNSSMPLNFEIVTGNELLETKDVVSQKIHPVVDSQTNRAFLERYEWLQVEPDNGFIPAGSEMIINVLFDSNNLEPFLYSTNLIIIPEMGFPQYIPVLFEVKTPDLPTPENLDFCQITNFLSWQSPDFKNLQLLGYNVYLNNVIIGTTVQTQFLLNNLVIDQTYEAGIKSLYNWGLSEKVILEFEYTGVYTENYYSPVTNLTGNHPNPFNPKTSINFTLASTDRIVIDIFNIKGELVKNLVESELEAGSYSLIWDGRDKFGNQLSSGIYLYRMKTTDYQSIKKMMLLK